MGSNPMISTFPFVAGIMGIIFLALGLRGVLTKKPYIISSRWMFLAMIINFSPSILGISPMFTTPSSLRGDPIFSIMPWMLLGLYAIMLIFMWLAMQGYTVHGVTDTSFRTGLINTLEKLEIPFEENLGGIYLSSLGANLKVTIQSNLGTAQINIRPRKFNNTLDNIAKNLSTYYQANPTTVNLITCYFYVVFGVLMVAMGVMFASWVNLR
jgi:hypothetical protein